jgi:hypothetical protein
MVWWSMYACDELIESCELINMEINLIIIRDFEKMLIWWIYFNQSVDTVWEIWNLNFKWYDFDVLSFNDNDELNKFLKWELPKL